MIKSGFAGKHGFTLIEVLVSLLIFTVGLLGYGLLQQRSQAQLFKLEQRLLGLHWVNNTVNEIASIQAAQSKSDIPVEGLIGGLGCIQWHQASSTYHITLIWQEPSATQVSSCDQKSLVGSVKGSAISRSIRMADLNWMEK